MQPQFVIDLAVFVIVGTAFLKAFLTFIGKVQLPVKDAGWIVFGTTISSSVVALLLGMMLGDRIGLIVALGSLFQVFVSFCLIGLFVRVKNLTVVPWRVWVVSVLLTLVGFFISPPIAHLVCLGFGLER